MSPIETSLHPKMPNILNIEEDHDDDDSPGKVAKFPFTRERFMVVNVCYVYP